MPIAPQLPFPDPTPGQIRGSLTPNNPGYYQPGNPGYASTFNAPGNSFGQVLGASTTSQQPGLTLSPLAPPPVTPPPAQTTPTPSTVGTSAPDTSGLLAAGTQGINDNFNAYSSGIDQIKGSIEKQIADLQNGVGSMSDQLNGQYTTNQNALNSSQQQANQQVDTTQANSIRDLEDNLRSQYSAANRQLGSVGAGDSSAVGQYAQAIADQGSKARSQLMMQAQQLHTSIGQQFSDQLNQLNGWKSSQVLSLVNNYKSQEQQLDQQRIGANSDKVAQINNLKLQLQQQASTALSQVDNQSSYWSDQLAKQQQAYQSQVAQIGQIASLAPGMDTSQLTALGNTALQFQNPASSNIQGLQLQPIDTSAISAGIANGGLKLDPNQQNQVQF